MAPDELDAASARLGGERLALQDLAYRVTGHAFVPAHSDATARAWASLEDLLLTCGLLLRAAADEVARKQEALARAAYLYREADGQAASRPP